MPAGDAGVVEDDVGGGVPPEDQFSLDFDAVSGLSTKENQAAGFGLFRFDDRRGGRLTALKFDGDGADLDLVARLQIGSARDELGVDEGAAGAAEIFDRTRFSIPDKAAVQAGDIQLGEGERRGGRSPGDEFSRRERENSRGAPADD